MSFGAQSLVGAGYLSAWLGFYFILLFVMLEIEPTFCAKLHSELYFILFFKMTAS